MTGTISNTSATPVVLIADDLPRVITMWTRGLANYGIDVVAATSLQELDDVYDRYKHSIVAIILDGCIPGHSVNTLDFIRAVRTRGFTEPIVASSSLWEYRYMMMRAGCSHEAPKEQAVHVVADLLSAP